ncbi:MAG TPA: prepilin peptidase [Pilimelia sp.]|nr:prepilin peptidase [Pilimelia sp.]
MPATTLVPAGLLGLAVGSFLNVVIHRVPRGESLWLPASRCPACGTALRPWHNVPVLSWLALRGRCADCGEKISIRYPLVEAATAALFVAVTARLGLSPQLPAYLYLAAVAVALAVIDIDVKRLPDAIVRPSYVVGAALLLPAVAADGDWPAAGRALLAAVALYGFYLALASLYRGGMGWGDVKLAGLLGLYLGYLGWGSVLIGTFAGFLLGGVVGAVLLATRRAGRRSELPFGPFMLAGAFLAVFFAAPLGTWYTSLLTGPT